MGSSPASWGVGATLAWSLAAFIFGVIAALIVSAGWWVFEGAGPDEWIDYQREHAVAKVFREIVFNCGVAGVVILAAYFSPISIRDYLALVPPRGSLAEVIVVSAAALAACGLSLYGLAFALGFEFGFSSSTLTVAALLGWTQKAIFGPVSEELLFRGFMYRGLAASRLGTWGAIAVTTVLFAVIHLTSVSGEALWFHYVFVTVMGVMFGLLRARTGSLLPPMVVHSIWNGWPGIAEVEFSV